MSIKYIYIIFLITINQSGFTESKIKFDWGKSKAVVTETVNKNNSIMKVQYQIELKKKRGGFVLKQGRVKLISVNGMEIKDAATEKQSAVLFSLPNMKLDDKGELLEVIDADEYIESFIDSLPDPRARKFYENPQMQNLIFMKAYEKWCYWVCLWTDTGLSETSPIEANEEVEFMGMLLPQRTVITHHGVDEESAEHVKLSYLTETGINNPKEFIDNLSKELQFVRSDEKDQDMPKSGSKVMNVEAIIEENTLKPLRIVVDTKITMKSSNQVLIKEEKHVFEFVWK